MAGEVRGVAESGRGMEVLLRKLSMYRVSCKGHRLTIEPEIYTVGILGKARRSVSYVSNKGAGHSSRDEVQGISYPEAYPIVP